MFRDDSQKVVHSSITRALHAQPFLYDDSAEKLAVSLCRRPHRPVLQQAGNTIKPPSRLVFFFKPLIVDVLSFLHCAGRHNAKQHQAKHPP